MNNRRIAGCVLAGGNGSRAEGKDKCLFTYEGKTFLERSMEVFLDWDECILSYNRDDSEVQPVLAKLNRYRHVMGTSDICIVQDMEEVRGIGPVAGLYSVLLQCNQDAILVTPCDVPFFRQQIVDVLLKAVRPGVEAVVMTSQGRLQPLCGIYTKAVLPVMKQCMEEQSYKPRCILERVKTVYIAAEDNDIPPISFENINTLEELEKLRGYVDKIDEK